jgi:hypothetical protein
MNLENPLGQVEPDRHNRFHEGLPLLRNVNDHQLGIINVARGPSTPSDLAPE